MNIWILILTVITNDGSVKTLLNFPQKPEYNTQAGCTESGQAIANELQLKLGTSNAKIYFYCDGVPRSELLKSLTGA